jgi:hypothetical protein
MLIPLDELRERTRDRLLGGRSVRRVVWESASDEVLVHADTLRVRARGGWLVGDLDLEASETGRETLQIVFFVGTQNDGAGPRAVSTMADRDPSPLMRRWGVTFQQTIWDALLDLVTERLEERRTATRETIILQGFHAGRQGVELRIAEGGDG